MDRKTILAIVIITLILISYPYYIKMVSPPPEPAMQEELQDISQRSRAGKKTVEESPAAKAVQAEAPVAEQLEEKKEAEAAEESKRLEIVQDSTVRTVDFENENIAVTLSNRKGANIVSWRLKGFMGRDSQAVEMIDNNYFAVQFNDWNGDFVDLSEYTFFFDGKTEQRSETVVRFYLPYKGGRIYKTYIFNNRGYDYKLVINFDGLRQNFIGKQYGLTWMNGLPPAEHVLTEDAGYASSQVRIAGDLEIYKDAGDDPETMEGKNIQWAASRIKYFTIATVPLQKDNVTSVKLFGVEEEIGEHKYGRYSYTMNVRHPQPASADSFLVYMGPLNYEILEAYNADLEDMVLGSSGYERFFRPFSLFLLKILKLLHYVIPNYGVAIIVFSILLKLVLFPFTRSSYRSMKAMQKLQPEMKELKEKYKNDPQALQKKTMELYKEHKVNPMGGCLPMLLQMPVLFAMYIVFRSTVQLRGEAFFGWISDLSRPDVIAVLPFSIPLYGDQLTVLPLLMALSMFFQQKQTVQDPSQKFMIYFFPVMMLFIFNQFPSGLNLYYTVFNVLTIAQQHFIKINEDEFKLGKPKKNGLAFARKKKK